MDNNIVKYYLQNSATNLQYMMDFGDWDEHYCSFLDLTKLYNISEPTYIAFSKYSTHIDKVLDVIRGNVLGVMLSHDQVTVDIIISVVQLRERVANDFNLTLFVPDQQASRALTIPITGDVDPFALQEQILELEKIHVK